MTNRGLQLVGVACVTSIALLLTAGTDRAVAAYDAYLYSLHSPTECTEPGGPINVIFYGANVTPLSVKTALGNRMGFGEDNIDAPGRAFTDSCEVNQHVLFGSAGEGNGFRIRLAADSAPGSVAAMIYRGHSVTDDCFAPDPGSGSNGGLNRGRDAVERAFSRAQYQTTLENWKNTDEFSACDGTAVGSDGYILYVNMDSSNGLSLLQRYKPILQYHSEENYSADSAAEMTDNYRGSTITGSNVLTLNGETLAAANPHLGYLGYSHLSFYELGFRSDDFGSATEDEILNARGNGEGEYLPDYQRLHADGEYADLIYGRRVDYPGPALEVGVVLQYWLFYYYNPGSALGSFSHEGDWELVQVNLRPNLTPHSATYAQHGHAETCDWAHVLHPAADHPEVYVAHNSHASYFSGGDHPLSGNPGVDHTDSGGRRMTPDKLTLTNITNIEDAPGAGTWVAWRGRWGGSEANEPSESDSPLAPVAQTNGSWDDPRAWAGTETSCTED